MSPLLIAGIILVVVGVLVALAMARCAHISDERDEREMNDLARERLGERRH